MQGAFQFEPKDVLEQRLREVYAGVNVMRKLRLEEYRMLNLLGSHRGAARPLPLEAIARDLNLSDREVKATVKDLVEVFQIPIGARRDEPHGYFLVETPADIEVALAPYIHELQSLARRIRALSNDHRLKELLGQMEIESLNH